MKLTINEKKIIVRALKLKIEDLNLERYKNKDLIDYQIKGIRELMNKIERSIND